MKQIRCNGIPFELGFQHGDAAKDEIDRSLIFYGRLFEKTAGLTWPEYCDEMQGIAIGAGVPYHSILALNVRTEIAYGLSKDGCTALYHRTPSTAFLAQNWDWQTEQRENLISITLVQPSVTSVQPRKPTISMITEAGIIGKIGLNSSGVGVCLNAIRALGVDFGRLPCHLALRTALECESRREAVERLTACGVASACHILIADSAGASGLECSSADLIELPSEKILTHTNHFLVHHPGVEDIMALQDSPRRQGRINQLIEEQLGKSDDDNVIKTEQVFAVLEDEDHLPTAICRATTHDSSVATLFSIVMDLKVKNAEVRQGRPSETGVDTMSLHPS